jgi:hemerythrin
MDTQLHARAYQTGTDEVDAEHRVQLALIHALADMLARRPRAPEVGQLFERFLAYSEAHFMSEELLMRLYAYPGYEEHARDHAALADRFRALRHRYGDDPGAITAEMLLGYRAALAGHMLTRDEQFETFLQHLMAPAP